MIKIDFKDKDTNNYEIGTSAEDIVKNTYGRNIQYNLSVSYTHLTLPTILLV